MRVLIAVFLTFAVASASWVVPHGIGPKVVPVVPVPSIGAGVSVEGPSGNIETGPGGVIVKGPTPAVVAGPVRPIAPIVPIVRPEIGIIRESIIRPEARIVARPEIGLIREDIIRPEGRLELVKW